MEEEINEIINHNNTIQDPLLSEKIELKLQKQNNITIPSIILEYLSPENVTKSRKYWRKESKNWEFDIKSDWALTLQTTDYNMKEFREYCKSNGCELINGGKMIYNDVAKKVYIDALDLKVNLSKLFEVYGQPKLGHIEDDIKSVLYAKENSDFIQEMHAKELYKKCYEIVNGYLNHSISIGQFLTSIESLGVDEISCSKWLIYMQERSLI